MIRVGRRGLWCQSGIFFFVLTTSQGPCLRQPYSLLPSKLRYETVACPSHLTMLSRADAFSFSSYHFSRLFPRRRFGLKFPILRPGRAAHARSPPPQAPSCPPYQAASISRLVSLCALSIASDDSHYVTLNVPFALYFTDMYFPARPACNPM